MKLRIIGSTKECLAFWLFFFDFLRLYDLKDFGFRITKSSGLLYCRDGNTRRQYFDLEVEYPDV